MMRMLKGYISSLFDPEFVSTGLKTAVFVGSLLFVINHGLALLRGEMNRERWISVIATYAMPYLVNVYGQYSYRRKLDGKGAAADDD
ncbi:hypothetical protein C7B82_30775 [Stenomitos frigidus ULC18]|uniref:Uncharacterized protein n=1 Tax=Stenomitos frigidus ULC18 TaxID=2107698 RepID=A0A2T1DT59_9CYAN|nr:hypothetical protein C7B82_30775 [Stenomitos frigidus ULC18]